MQIQLELLISSTPATLITHHLGLFCPHDFFKPIILQTSVLQTSKETHKDHRLQVQSASVLQRQGMKQPQIPKVLVAHKQDMLWNTALSMKSFLWKPSLSLLLLLRLFSQKKGKKISKVLDNHQRGSELNSQALVQMPNGDQQRGSSHYSPHSLANPRKHCHPS